MLRMWFLFCTSPQHLPNIFRAWTLRICEYNPYQIHSYSHYVYEGNSNKVLYPLRVTQIYSSFIPLFCSCFFSLLLIFKCFYFYLNHQLFHVQHNGHYLCFNDQKKNLKWEKNLQTSSRFLVDTHNVYIRLLPPRLSDIELIHWFREWG
jgi:hypothetical protein